MEPADYPAWTDRLVLNLQEDDRVRGLVALGSTAEPGDRADRWSDHDVFVVVETGAQELFRNDRSWLPRPDLIAYGFRGTAHGQFLTNLFVGVGRYERGERLSAHRFIRQHALQRLIGLVERFAAPADPSARDSLDPTRCFERVYPAIGVELDRLLGRPIPGCALGMLDVADRDIRPRWSDYPAAAAGVVRERIERRGEAPTRIRP